MGVVNGFFGLCLGHGQVIPIGRVLQNSWHSSMYRERGEPMAVDESICASSVR